MDEKKVREAIYCMKASIGETMCEECVNYYKCDHTKMDDMMRNAIEALEKQLLKKPIEIKETYTSKIGAWKMNRKIIFKAKRKDNGEWVEGLPGYDINGNITELEVHKKIGDCRIYEIDPDTLCQYTGLTDKNGKKIWENDILIGHGNDRDLSKVVFGKFHVIDAETLRRVDEVIGWHTEVIETDALSKCEPFCLPMPLTDFYIERSEFEVYGNIFDNPDLLEVE